MTPNLISAQGFEFKKSSFTIENQNLVEKEYSNKIFPQESTLQSFDLYNFVEIQSILEEKKSFKVLPLFCKMEALVYKSSKINLRINLGSNEYVRMLEGKPN
jgi:hypothetical protein